MTNFPTRTHRRYKGRTVTAVTAAEDVRYANQGWTPVAAKARPKPATAKAEAPADADKN